MPELDPDPSPRTPPARWHWRALLTPREGGDFSVYAAADGESAAIRAAHLKAVLRLTPTMMAANLINGLLLALVMRPELPVGFWWWFLALLAVTVLALKKWWHGREGERSRASPRAVRHATLHAMLLASLWAIVPLFWFATASAAQQFIIACVMIGLMAGGAMVLAPLPTAALSYMVILTVSALVALVATRLPHHLATAGYLACFSTVVAFGVLETARKRTALLRAEREAARQGRLVAVLLNDFEEHAAEAMWQTEVDGMLVHPSVRLRELLDVSESDLQTLPLHALVALRDAHAAASLRQVLTAGRPFRDLRLAVAQTDGARQWWSLSGKRLIDDAGRPAGWRGVLADVTAETEVHERLRMLAHTDSLTGLANRLTFHESSRLALSQRRAAALLSIDLDHFKSVNDTLGHSGGDALLRAVAQRLAQAVRSGDLVARLGGDEFAVLVHAPCSLAEIEAMADRIIAALGAPVDIEGRRLQLGASVGIAMVTDDGAGADEMHVRADMALYAAKEAGRGRHAVFRAQLGERSRRQLALAQGLRHAVEQGQLELHWQPRVDLARWRVVGAEGLLRWTHPELGVIAPSEFIPVAEQTGLIHDLGAWALREACATVAQRLSGLPVSVNVSAVQFADGGFAARVADAVHAAGIDPRLLELEITESVFIGEAQRTVEQLHALRRLGVRIALDDFGTGYSSLAYLRRFPFDTLKIDRAFVNEMLQRQDAVAIVQMIAALADTLGMRTVAEGVESLPQLAAVAGAGCQEVQGYLISGPKPIDELQRLRGHWVERSPLVDTLH